VPAWDSQWNSEEIEAMWDSASQLWVPGRSRVHGRPYLSFCPITLRHFSFMSWRIRRWMHNSEWSSFGTLFCLVWALEGGIRGWEIPQGCPPQKVKVPFKKTSWRGYQIPTRIPLSCSVSSCSAMYTKLCSFDPGWKHKQPFLPLALVWSTSFSRGVSLICTPFCFQR